MSRDRHTNDSPKTAIEKVFREEHGRIIAGLISAVGDFDLAEESLQEAMATALARWPSEGVPKNPGAWLTTAARRKAIDVFRREKMRGQKQAAALPGHEPEEREFEMVEQTLESSLGDDRLRLIFTCCHPALNMEARVALTLRTLGGLTTPEIARAFLLPERVPAVLAVIYLVFNEAYAASTGNDLIRNDLADEAIRLGRVLFSLMPDESEVAGLLALMLLQDSRKTARVDDRGEQVLLEDQDRSKWDRQKIGEGTLILEEALRRRTPGPYQLQAAIAAVHCEAKHPEDTDWRQIVALYSALDALQPSPIISLNRAVAVAMAYGAEEGFRAVEKLSQDEQLSRYLFYHSTRADLLRRLDRNPEAADAYREALTLAENEPERRFLKRRLHEVSSRN
jgi:RNA polymerase sigma-70 factor (ECF subfamily)